MNDVFFAHSVKEKGREAWEPLIDHLTDVGERAARFATAFGYGEFGYAAGLLHDLGKYQAAFQARLAGNAEPVDHAAHGACYARRALHPLGGLIAHAIAGHHGGLADNLLTSDPESRLGRMGLTLDAIVARPVDGGTHSYEYRLFYGRGSERIVGYDNERSKGDHRHLDGVEEPYAFSTVATLVRDFLADVEKRRLK